MPPGKPDPEWVVDEGVVRALLLEQHPDLADAPVRGVDEGWDNVMYRVGDDLAARLPRREAGVPLLLHERRWLPELAARLSVAVPEPVRLGAPSARFVHPWNLVRWISGPTADMEPLRDDQAARLARELRSLHRPAPADAPANLMRGEPLATRDAFARERIRGLPGATPERRRLLEEVWSRGVAAEESPIRVWIHGDLHPKNVVVRDGRLAGILDWGDITSGDPATDLASAWTLLETPGARAAFWAASGTDAASIRRARAWAVLFGAITASSGEERHERIGRRILERVLGDDGEAG